jgi:hypothetical protein
MNIDAFYSAASALCFTLLGFWWVVVQFRHAELTHDRGPRRFAFLVSLHFILPGLASLASLLAGTGTLWRLTFGITGVTGVTGVTGIAATPCRFSTCRSRVEHGARSLGRPGSACRSMPACS